MAFMVVIRAPLGDSAVSCVYAFLTEKSHQIYEQLLTAIMDKGKEIGVDMNPTTIVIDVEQAAINAVQTILGPHVNDRGCFFYLTQSTWRKAHSLGLSQRYKDDDDVKHFCGMLDGLAFLQPDRIQDRMDYIRNHTTDELEDLVNYFDTTYVSDLPPIGDLELGCAGDHNTEEADGYEESDDVEICIPKVDFLQGVSTSKLKRVKDDCKWVKGDEDVDRGKRPKVHERCRRRPWTVEENRALSILFRKQLKGTSKCIRNADLIKAKQQFPCLDSPTLPQIRTKLNNIMLGEYL